MASPSSVGNCGAIGEYTAKAAAKGTLAKQEAFVVTETNGHWGTPAPIAHLATLNTMGQVDDLRIVCSAPGFCLAGGDYVTKLTATSGFVHPFVVQESKGVWGGARTFDTSGLSAGANGAGSLDAFSCSSAGNCAVGADYGGAQGSVPFVAVQQNGTWGKPEQIPGMAALLGTEKSVVAVPRAISCADSADCTVVGDYPSHGKMDAFIATDSQGVWADAKPLPGLAALQSAASTRYTDVDGMACDSAGGNCTVAGVFTNLQGKTVPFVLTKTGGSLGTVRQLPGTSKLNLSNGNGGGVLLACPTQATCTIVTVAWTAASPAEPPQFGNSQVYLDAEVNGAWGPVRQLGGVPAGDGAGARVTALRLSRAAITFGKEGAEKLTVSVSGPPAARVTVTAGKTALCTVTLTASGKALKPGTYRLVAAYRGTAVYVASQSAAAKLTVRK